MLEISQGKPENLTKEILQVLNQNPEINGVTNLLIHDVGDFIMKILLRLDPSRRRSFLEKKRKMQKGPEKSSYYDKLV